MVNNITTKTTAASTKFTFTPGKVRMIRSFASHLSDNEAEEIALKWDAKEAAGATSCVIHEVWEHRAADREAMPRCALCGGRGVEPGGVHTLCRIKKQRGLIVNPLQIDSYDKCLCAACN